MKEAEGVMHADAEFCTTESHTQSQELTVFKDLVFTKSLSL